MVDSARETIIGNYTITENITVGLITLGIAQVGNVLFTAEKDGVLKNIMAKVNTEFVANDFQGALYTYDADASAVLNNFYAGVGDGASPSFWPNILISTTVRRTILNAGAHQWYSFEFDGTQDHKAPSLTKGTKYVLSFRAFGIFNDADIRGKTLGLGSVSPTGMTYNMDADADYPKGITPATINSYSYSYIDFCIAATVDSLPQAWIMTIGNMGLSN